MAQTQRPSECHTLNGNQVYQDEVIHVALELESQNDILQEKRLGKKEVASWDLYVQQSIFEQGQNGCRFRSALHSTLPE